MDKIYSMWLHKLSIPEYIKIEMLSYYKSYQAIYNAKGESYKKFGLKETQIDKIQKSKLSLGTFEEIYKTCIKDNIYMIDILDSNYPYLLKQIPDPPILIFVKGQLECLNAPVIAIVGSRKCSEYGFEVTCKLSEQLAELGLSVISGMAVGIDEAAHKGALKTGNTIAVLGTGINVCYPSQNRNIYEIIPKKGCLITEFFLDAPALPFQFPKRNRIISGMAQGILVVEADVNSGSLITANLALEYNRDVFAVPGNITSRLSLGTNELIKSGAKCVTKVEDIIEELPKVFQDKLEVSKKNNYRNCCCELAQDESIVYAYVSQNPIDLKDLFENTKLSCEIVYPSLLKLEIKGLIKRLPGERYVRM